MIPDSIQTIILEFLEQSHPTVTLTVGSIATALKLEVDLLIDDIQVLASEHYIILKTLPGLPEYEARVAISQHGKSALASMRKQNRKNSAATSLSQVEQMSSASVMVVHGRNVEARDELFNFLRAIDLKPVDWNEAVAWAGGGSPQTESIVRAALTSAGAIIVLFTADDRVRLNSRLLLPSDTATEREEQPQVRPNVLLELGMALMVAERKTIIFEIERTKSVSDIVGRNSIRYDEHEVFRQSLIDRLDHIGCPVNRKGSHWLSAGNFKRVRANAAVAVPQSKVQRKSRRLYRLDVRKVLDAAADQMSQQDPSNKILSLLSVEHTDNDHRIFLGTTEGRYPPASKVKQLEEVMSGILGFPISIQIVSSRT